MNIAELKAQLLQLRDWAKQNPALAAVGAAGVLFVIVFIGVIIALVSAGGERDLARAESEANICKRTEQLAKMESKDTKGLSPGYVAALRKSYQELTHEEPSSEDALSLGRVSGNCEGVDNETFAWTVQIETRVKRGRWPSYPVQPPAADATRAALRQALTRDAQPVLPSEPAARTQWLRFVADGKESESKALLEQLLRADAPQVEELAAYESLLDFGSSAAWLAQKFYDKLNLLAEPLFVRDGQPQPGQPANLSLGPDKTLRFVGVLEGERCAIAVNDAKLPHLWVRPCTGLVPRRLAGGELVLVGAMARLDRQTPAHWLPVLIDDCGELAFGRKLGVDVRELAAFMVAAPRFALQGKELKKFDPAPSVALAHDPIAGGEGFASFKSDAQGKPTLIVFDQKVAVSQAEKCPKVEAARCAPLKGDKNRCSLEASQCFILPGETEIRTTAATVVKPLPCMEEVGEKCPFATSVGMFVDVRHADESAFTDGAFIELHSGD